MTNPQNCEDCGRFGPVVVLGSGRFSFKVCESCARSIAENVAAEAAYCRSIGITAAEEV